MLLKLVILVTVKSVLWSPVFPRVDAFHGPSPSFYINFFEDEDLLGQEEYSEFTKEKLDSKLFENGFSTVTNSLTEIPQKDTFATETKIPTLTENNKTSDLSKLMNLSVLEPHSTKDNLIKSSTGAAISTSISNLYNKMDHPKDSHTTTNTDSNEFSVQFTKLYLRAISSLIQDIISAIFTVNEPPTNTKLGDSFENFVSEPDSLRKLKKRDLSETEVEETSMSSTSVNVHNLKSLTDKNEDVKDMVLGSFTGSANGQESNVNTTSSTAVKNTELIREISTNTTESTINTNNEEKTKHVSHKTDNIHVTFVSPANLIGKNKNSNLKDGAASLEEEIILDNSALMDEKNANLLELNPEAYNRPKKVHRLIDEESGPGQFPSKRSNMENFLIATGTFLVVLILVTAGTAAGYVARKRMLRESQTGNQQSTQRTAMA